MLNIIYFNIIWLVVLTILKNDGVRQLGWWNSQLFMESHNPSMFQSPPTSHKYQSKKWQMSSLAVKILRSFSLNSAISKSSAENDRKDSRGNIMAAWTFMFFFVISIYSFQGMQHIFSYDRKMIGSFPIVRNFTASKRSKTLLAAEFSNHATQIRQISHVWRENQASKLLSTSHYSILVQVWRSHLWYNQEMLKAWKLPRTL